MGAMLPAQKKTYLSRKWLSILIIIYGVIAVVNRTYEWLAKYLRRFCIRVIRHGKIPRHIGFIMDGNRRYAIRRGLGSKRLGHYAGFQRLESVLEWCWDLGVQTVTVYAFSLENFKRPIEEVETLMSLTADKLTALSKDSELVRKYGVRIRVLGNLEELPDNVKKAAVQAMEYTKANCKCVLNICCPYTSRHEMLTVINQLRNCPDPNMVDSKLMDAMMFTNSYAPSNNRASSEPSLFELSPNNIHAPPPIDLLIRTSGEHRLSEFLTWQITYSQRCRIEFVQRLWPEFRFFHFLPILLRFQLENDSIMAPPLAQSTLTRQQQLYIEEARESYEASLKVKEYTICN